MNRNYNKRVIFYAVVSVFTFVIAWSWFFQKQLKCFTIDWSRYQQIAADVYVNPEMGEEQRFKLLMDIEDARERLKAFMGDSGSRPVIIAANQPEVMAEFGAGLKSPGMNHITPFGTYIVLGPEGLNQDVICHELCHSELANRVGWYNREAKIPAWFDEGLALMLDYRYARTDFMWAVVTENGKKAPSLNELAHMQDFMHYTRISPFLSYVTSMREVSRWWNVAGGPVGFNLFVEKIKAGEPFEKAYKDVEAHWQHRQNSED